MVGWGGTFGALRQASSKLQAEGKKVSHLHLRWLWPLHRELGPLLKRFKKILVPELNMGQLRLILRAEYLVDAQGLNKIQGQPFKVSDITDKVATLL